MSNQQFCVYQHINPTTKTIFYFGSGMIKRAHSLSYSTRSESYKLYCKNNNLIEKNKNNNVLKFNVDVQILQYFDTKEESMQYEFDLIKQYYGIYPLINSLVSEKHFVNNDIDLKIRSDKVSLAKSVNVINLFDNSIFNSITEMAKFYQMERTTLQKRLQNIELKTGLINPKIEDLHLFDIKYKNNVLPVKVL